VRYVELFSFLFLVLFPVVLGGALGGRRAVGGQRCFLEERRLWRRGLEGVDRMGWIGGSMRVVSRTGILSKDSVSPTPMRKTLTICWRCLLTVLSS